MVRLRRTRKVLRGRGPWPCLDTILNYKRDPSHSTNEHVDHVANMFKRFEEEYILESNRKKHILQMSLTEPEKKVLENIWESIQEGPHGFTNRSFDDLVAIFKEHRETCSVKNAIRRTIVLSISPNLRNARFSNSSRHKNLRGLWLLKTTSRVIEDTVYNPNIAAFSFKGED
ncbi:hypothetical protein CK203_103458 [Vitis vinifera]|uniref:Uncharacterized protein n=1 Tax=Vitis vinifera TaxID=29760 RepID=A0A438BL56_VITVI|nr:hypothetical protein CK203_103458 [Vitis vinifera]